MNPRRALSLKQPYAEQILRGDKVAEFRDRPTRIRERVYIYASRTPGPAAEFAKLHLEPGDLPVGVLVGTVEIVGSTGAGKNYTWHLARPERLAQPLQPANRAQPIWFYPFGK
jgi:hypothetical protein